MNLNTYLSPYRKLFLKWDIYLNEKVETIKLLKENIGEYLYDLNGRKIFPGEDTKYNQRQRNLEIRLSKLKNICLSKDIIKKMNKQPQMGESIPPKYISNK